VFSSTSLWEEGVESIITTTNSFVRWHLTIRLNSVLETEEFPAGVTDLNTPLTNVNGDNLSHACVLFKKIITYNIFFKFLKYKGGSILIRCIFYKWLIIWDYETCNLIQINHNLG
jgi:hypothetical protein